MYEQTIISRPARQGLLISPFHTGFPGHVGYGEFAGSNFLPPHYPALLCSSAGLFQISRWQHTQAQALEPSITYQVAANNHMLAQAGSLMELFAQPRHLRIAKRTTELHEAPRHAHKPLWTVLLLPDAISVRFHLSHDGAAKLTIHRPVQHVARNYVCTYAHQDTAAGQGHVHLCCQKQKIRMPACSHDPAASAGRTPLGCCSSRPQPAHGAPVTWQP